ncbi:MAG: 1-acyl-sn-glycerol-3-phosphate acyltransferase [Oscillospiraceae bacterium]|jgi:1-acyl-sn-glycerol-3-phosphate acyltransferase|nr:1-acyl-sn-glycerol-3-phosphate acyltransferase [Oscillospiraceae bacterium]
MFYKFAHVVVGAIYRLLYRFRVTGREHVPEGGALVCVNHSSMADPVIIALALKRKDRPRFMAKMELFKIFGLKQLITALGAYPVERGVSDMSAIRKTLDILKSKNKVLIFPQGSRIINDAEAAAMKNGAAMLAFRSGAPLLPVYLSVGRKVFINKIQVAFGKPFLAEKQPGGKSSEQYAELAERLRREIYALKPPGKKQRDD